MTYRERMAATECVRLMALLAGSKTPHAKELAVCVSARLLAISQGNAGKVMTDKRLAEWIDLARQLVTAIGEAPTGGAS